MATRLKALGFATARSSARIRSTSAMASMRGSTSTTTTSAKSARQRRWPCRSGGRTKPSPGLSIGSAVNPTSGLRGSTSSIRTRLTGRPQSGRRAFHQTHMPAEVAWTDAALGRLFDMSRAAPADARRRDVRPRGKSRRTWRDSPMACLRTNQRCTCRSSSRRSDRAADDPAEPRSRVLPGTSICFRPCSSIESPPPGDFPGRSLLDIWRAAEAKIVRRISSR